MALEARLWCHKEMFAPCLQSLSLSSCSPRTKPRHSSITKPSQTRPGEVDNPTSLNITKTTQISPWAPHHSNYTVITSSAIKSFSKCESALGGRKSTLICVCHAQGGLPALPAQLGSSLARSRAPLMLALPGWQAVVPSLLTSSPCPWSQACPS